MRSKASATLIDEVYHEILEPSFGPDELDTLDTLVEGLAEGWTWGLCAVDGETPVGCVLGYPYVESRLLLIGYVTVKPARRGTGIGGLLLAEAEERWYGQVDVVVAEIEDPRHHPVVGDIDPKRRVTFYARRGARVIVGPYFQPRLGGEGKKRVYHLFLTVLGGRGEVGPENALATGLLKDFILDYFRDSGEGSDFPRADDAEGNRLVAWYCSRDTVPLHPIGDYEHIEIPQ
ncbi:GNAT family N-acetyltransferase [Mycobacterium parmense]|uniref:Uncharacterized protein n=1 Tax=Mycobacterium parmense TaxID=185642 RepID=A0A7I7YVC1_9MYCO|nr:GNAT family N-acetyltransferase [Mycobacterium parmense]MCV7351312.1 GNAT family N-acetyltransferase [Mycobacterium parmense]ORW60837.1 hypothetical protein AWC20_07840 [Mycobacterium parmense]BBZ45232.1 hypothetical protein MPRM_25130 [Mycobacterium parmense]